jgi:hypothetical protein
MGDIYEVRRRDGLRCHDMHTKLHKDPFSHSKLMVGGEYIDLLVFKNKERRLKTEANSGRGIRLYRHVWSV